jgi:hypothetical protein
MSLSFSKGRKPLSAVLVFCLPLAAGKSVRATLDFITVREYITRSRARAARRVTGAAECTPCTFLPSVAQNAKNSAHES